MRAVHGLIGEAASHAPVGAGEDLLSAPAILAQHGSGGPAYCAQDPGVAVRAVAQHRSQHHQRPAVNVSAASRLIAHFVYPLDS
jgi:hypothetical protein